MRFRLEFAVKGLLINWGRSALLKFDCPGRHHATVTLQPVSAAEEASGYKKEDALGTAISEQEPNARVRAMFESLARKQLPEGSEIPTFLGRPIDEEGRIQEGFIVPMDILPQPFKSFSGQVDEELWDCAKRATLVLRWRYAGSGAHSPFVFRAMSWSFDGEDWMPMPSTLQVSTEVIAWLRVTEQDVQEVGELINRGLDEPLGHQLYREAWEQRHSNPRSSLVIGIAAAEIGIKQHIAVLVPGSRWLVENIPSPPLVNILREYLPKLPNKNKLDGDIPSLVIDTLKTGVTLRNDTVHGRSATLPYETLEPILLAVRDLLWILDYYRGFDWATKHVRPETLKRRTT